MGTTYTSDFVSHLKFLSSEWADVEPDMQHATARTFRPPIPLLLLLLLLLRADEVIE